MNDCMRKGAEYEKLYQSSMSVARATSSIAAGGRLLRLRLLRWLVVVRVSEDQTLRG